jgi:hypothetical protein
MINELNEAKALVNKYLEDGIKCPCCGQLCKMYKRTLNAQMARALIWLVFKFEKEKRWYNINEFPLIQGRHGGGDFAKLSFWDLINEKKKDNTDGDKRTSGFWMPSQLGISFVNQESRVPRQVYLFDNKVYGWSYDTITIRDALGNKFSYHELMAGIF